MNYTNMTRSELLSEFSNAHKVFYGSRPPEFLYNIMYSKTDVELRIAVCTLHNKISKGAEKDSKNA